jgi:hypothetical protein
MDIYKVTKENAGQSFEIRFVPNAANPKEYRLTRTILHKMEGKPYPLRNHHYFSYVMQDGKIQIFKYGKTINDYLVACLNGFYGTAEGNLLFVHMPVNNETDKNYNYKYYTKTKFGTYIYRETVEELMNYNWEDSFEYLEDPFSGMEKIIHSIVKFKPFMPFDLTENKYITFDVSEVHGFMKIDNLRFVEKEPLFKKGDDKEPILALYKNVQPLDEYAKSLGLNYSEDQPVNETNIFE